MRIFHNYKKGRRKGEKHMKEIVFLMIIFSAIFLILCIALIRWAKKREEKVYKEGIQTESVVCEVTSRLDDGLRRYYCYVSYTDELGRSQKALLNVASNLPIRRIVHIKYLPGRYDEAVFVSQELE